MQAVVLRQILKRVRRAVGGQIIGRRAQHRAALSQTTGNHAGFWIISNADCQVDTLADQANWVVIDVHLDAHFRVLCQKIR
ncbi:hypothetical protein D3C76_1715860 [compost metagenome]